MCNRLIFKYFFFDKKKVTLLLQKTCNFVTIFVPLFKPCNYFKVMLVPNTTHWLEICYY